jgi:hypothetical protein
VENGWSTRGLQLHDYFLAALAKSCRGLAGLWRSSIAILGMVATMVHRGRVWRKTERQDPSRPHVLPQYTCTFCRVQHPELACIPSAALPCVQARCRCRCQTAHYFVQSIARADHPGPVYSRVLVIPLAARRTPSNTGRRRQGQTRSLHLPCSCSTIIPLETAKHLDTRYPVIRFIPPILPSHARCGSLSLFFLTAFTRRLPKTRNTTDRKHFAA